MKVRHSVRLKISRNLGHNTNLAFNKFLKNRAVYTVHSIVLEIFVEIFYHDPTLTQGLFQEFLVGLAFRAVLHSFKDYSFVSFVLKQICLNSM